MKTLSELQAMNLEPRAVYLWTSVFSNMQERCRRLAENGKGGVIDEAVSIKHGACSYIPAWFVGKCGKLADEDCPKIWTEER